MISKYKLYHFLRNALKLHKRFQGKNNRGGTTVPPLNCLYKGSMYDRLFNCKLADYAALGTSTA